MKEKMRFKKIIILLLAIVLLIFACINIATIAPIKQRTDQRMSAFPTENLPLQKPAVIYWDKHLIPFIVAEEDEDCAFLLGMTHAHLRLGQMALFRQIVQAKLAESAGPLALPIDKSLRILNLTAAVDSIEKMLPQETKNWMQQYVDGINFYQRNLKLKPVEISVLDLELKPWTVKDILSIGRLIAIDVNWLGWFQWLKLQEKPYFREFWDRFAEIGGNSSPSFNSVSENFGGLISSGIKSGSNALVVSPSKSADSSALIASDPHLGLSIPNTWLIAGYKCPSFHVTGLMLPGIPMVLVGRNQNIAWAGTNMRAASSDLFELSEKQLANLDSTNEKLKVRWWFDQEVLLRSSELGPVVTDAPLLNAPEDQTLAMQWIGHQATDEFTSFLKVNKAQDWDDFFNAFESYGVSGQNFLYADRTGHIGMLLAVKIPDRSDNPEPVLFVSADKTSNKWNGTLNSTQLPFAFDPPQGFIISANNKPVENDPPLGYFFSANDRIDRLTELMEKTDRVDFEYLKKVQQDVFVPSAVKVRDLFVEKLQSTKFTSASSPNSMAFLDSLKNWNGHYETESIGALAFQLLSFHFIHDFYKKMYDEDAVEILLSTEHINDFLVQDLMTQNSVALATSLSEAMPNAVDDFQNINNWGEIHRLGLKHPFGNIPVIGKRFVFTDLPANGSYNSAMKTAHQISNKKHETFYGANARFIANMKNMDDNFFVLLGGQDGWISSDHFIDQVPLWREGKYIQVPLSVEKIQHQFEHRMDFKKSDN